MKYNEVKQFEKRTLKNLAAKIKLFKSGRTPSVYEKTQDVLEGYDRSDLQIKIDYLKWNFRNRHNAFCQYFNGTMYEQIERNSNTDPDFALIQKYISKWSNIIDVGVQDEEVICDCA